jgi:Protein of unknown function (DUF3800)
MHRISLEERFACLFPFRTQHESRWPFVIYTAYFDESDEKPVFSLAGYSAALDTWLHLDWRWQELLEHWNLEYFKASECENGLGQFAKYRDDPNDLRSELKRKERERLKEIKTQFIDAICDHHDDLQGYGTAVAVEDFARIISEDKLARQLFMDKPYYVAAQLCLVDAAMSARDANTRRPGDAQIEVRPVFDSHEEYSGIVKVMFDKFAKKNPRSAEILLPPTYDDDRCCSPLQVADTLAYEIRKLFTQQIRNPDEMQARVPLVRLRPAIYHIYALDYDGLKTIVANQSPDSIAPTRVKPEEL